MSKRTTCQLAHTFDKSKHFVTSPRDPYMASEKLDGLRCLWIPASRGELVGNVPFANIQKTPQLVGRRSTGLWTRGWKPIFCPDWWIKNLPPFSCDGELWIGYGRFQDTCSVVRQYEAGASDRGEWSEVSFRIFDSPAVHQIFSDGIVDVGGKGDILIELRGAIGWLRERGWKDCCAGTFEQTYLSLLDNIEQNNNCVVLPQMILKSMDDKERLYDTILAKGGEGVIYRKARGFYIAERSHFILKEKPWYDAEGELVGWTSGKETDKGSKLLGMMGNLILDYNGKRLELSGFTDEERRLSEEAEYWAVKNPGTEAPSLYADCIKKFGIGSTITFKYRELSSDGIPKEARFDRVRFGK